MFVLHVSIQQNQNQKQRSLYWGFGHMYKEKRDKTRFIAPSAGFVLEIGQLTLFPFLFPLFIEPIGLLFGLFIKIAHIPMKGNQRDNQRSHQVSHHERKHSQSILISITNIGKKFWNVKNIIIP